MEIRQDGTKIDNCFGISIRRVLNGFSNASFMYANVLDANIEEFTFFETLQIWESTDLLFEGWVTSIQADNGFLTVSMIDTFDMMRQYLVDENYANTLIDDLKIYLVSGEHTLEMRTTDNLNPLFEADQYNGYFAIMRDKTLDLTAGTPTHISGTGFNVNMEDAGIITNTYAKLSSDDDDYWWLKSYVNDPNDGIGGVGWTALILEVSLQALAIPVTATLESITITSRAYWWTRQAALSTNVAGGTISFFIADAIVNMSHMTGIIAIWPYSFNSGVNGEKSATIDLYQREIPLNQPNSYIKFNDNDVIYTNAYIGMLVRVNKDSNDLNKRVELYWDHLTASVKYRTDDFTSLNYEITDTVAQATLTFAESVNAIGLANGDLLTIGTSYNTAFSNLLQSSNVLPANLSFLVNNGEDIDGGVAQLAFGATGYDLWVNYCENLGYHWWIDYSTGFAVMRGQKIVASGDDTAITDYTPNYKRSLVPTKPGTIIVIWRNGTHIKIVDAGRPSLVKILRKDIVTIDEAINIADLYAAQYAADKPEISLEFDKYKALSLGTNYLIGTYTNMFCKSITYQQADPMSIIKTNAEFGGYLNE
jgi:hypothetical protein